MHELEEMFGALALVSDGVNARNVLALVLYLEWNEENGRELQISQISVEIRV